MYLRLQFLQYGMSTDEIIAGLMRHAGLDGWQTRLLALPSSPQVHLRLPNLGPVCRKLQVDYAPALLGFEVRRGKMVPKIEGVVVCQEFEELVVSAYLEEERWGGWGWGSVCVCGGCVCKCVERGKMRHRSCVVMSCEGLTLLLQCGATPTSAALVVQ